MFVRHLAARPKPRPPAKPFVKPVLHRITHKQRGHKWVFRPMQQVGTFSNL